MTKYDPTKRNPLPWYLLLAIAAGMIGLAAYSLSGAPDEVLQEMQQLKERTER